VVPSTTRSAAETSAHATVQNRRIVVDGKPFFPVMLLDQCSAADVSHARALGANLILNESCPGVSQRTQLGLLQTGGYAALPMAHDRPQGRRLIGWAYPDEPEGNGWTPASLQHTFAYRRGNPDGRLSFLTTGAGFFRGRYHDAHTPRDVYRRFASLADVAGFDLYPLNHCSSNLASVYDAQRAFEKVAGDTPTFQWIETGPLRPGYCGGFAMTRLQLRAEIWLAVAGGARGIGFFTHTWNPDHKALDVSPAIEHELRRQTTLLSALQPGLVGAPSPSTADSGAIKVIARTTPSAVYVFAVNSGNAYVKAQLHVPAAPDTGTMRVFGEQRDVRVDAHNFVDTFSPLAVHVYVRGR
jgi:hypothetical protein